MPIIDSPSGEICVQRSLSAVTVLLDHNIVLVRINVIIGNSSVFFSLFPKMDNECKVRICGGVAGYFFPDIQSAFQFLVEEFNPCFNLSVLIIGQFPSKRVLPCYFFRIGKIDGSKVFPVLCRIFSDSDQFIDIIRKNFIIFYGVSDHLQEFTVFFRFAFDQVYPRIRYVFVAQARCIFIDHEVILPRGIETDIFKRYFAAFIRYRRKCFPVVLMLMLVLRKDTAQAEDLEIIDLFFGRFVPIDQLCRLKIRMEANKCIPAIGVHVAFVINLGIITDHTSAVVAAYDIYLSLRRDRMSELRCAAVLDDFI